VTASEREAAPEAETAPAEPAGAASDTAAAEAGRATDASAQTGRAEQHQADAESAPRASQGTISVVLVHYDESPQQLRAGIDSLLSQERAPVEILVVNNEPGGELRETVRGYPDHVKVLEPGSNIGYTPGVNLAAVNASGDYLITLNPDAHVEPRCLERLGAVADSDPKILLVGAQILLEDGITRNAGANPLHPTGISPAGGFGEAREQGEPRDVAVVSGACCLIRREQFLRLGGFVDEFFMFYDDPEMGWRALIAGMRVVFVPDAAARHSYEFERRAQSKWFWLERNRAFTVLANYEARTLVLLGPLLLATELGLLGVAAYGRWLGQKLRSYAWVFAMRGRLKRQRREVQASRMRSDAEVLERFDVRMDSALLPPPGPALANAVWVPYMRLVRPLLRTRAAGTR
jgi:GT2 family glycosyltransferase